MHPSYDYLQLPLVAHGLSKPLVLFLGQGDGDDLALDLARPDIAAALLVGGALEDAALAEVANVGQLSLEAAVIAGLASSQRGSLACA